MAVTLCLTQKKKNVSSPKYNNDMLSEALPDPPMLIDGWKTGKREDLCFL